MILMGFFSSRKSYIGIDIGTSGIKIVELYKANTGIFLETYGFSETVDYELAASWHNDIKQTAKIINKIIRDAGISSRNAVASLPTFSVFSSIISLAKIEKKDIASAVNWEAKKVIPLPLEEMVLDWVIIQDSGEEKKQAHTKVLLTGAPRALVEKYINIFKLAQVNLLGLETETLSLVRSIMGNDRSTVAIVEIGTNTTDIAIVENSIPILSRSVDIGGLSITKAVARSLNISLQRAEQFKFDMGVSSFSGTGNIPKSIIDTISPITNEIRYIISMYRGKNGRQVEKIILSGGSAMLSDFAQYISQALNMTVIIGDPWAYVHYPQELAPTLKNLGSRLSVAVGLAMRDL